MKRIIKLMLIVFSAAILIYACNKTEKEEETTANAPYEAGVYITNQTVMFVYIPKSTGVTNVAITGDFNSWDEQGTPMEEAYPGIWIESMKLDYGIYQYKYVINNGEKTIHDPAGNASMPDGKGGKNSIIEIDME